MLSKRLIDLLRRRWPVLGGVTLLVGGILSMVSLGSEPAAYEAETRLIPPAALAEESPVSRDTFTVSRRTWELAAVIDAAFEGKDLNAADDDAVMQAISGAEVIPDREQAFRDAVTLSGGRGKGEPVRVVTVTRDPAAASRMADVFARAVRIETRTEADALLERAAEGIRGNLDRVNARLETLAEELGVSDESFKDLEQRLRGALEEVRALDRKIGDLNAQRGRDAQRLETLEAMEHRTREAFPVGSEDDVLASPFLGRLRGDIASARAERAGLRPLQSPEDAVAHQKLTARIELLKEEYYAEVARIRARDVLELRGKVAETDAELKALGEQRAVKAGEAGVLDGRLGRVRPLRAEAARLMREREDFEHARLRIEAALGQPRGFEIEGRAGEARPLTRSAPRWIPVFFLLGALLGIGAALLVERFDARIRTAGDLDRHLGLACLAEVKRTVGPDRYVVQASAKDPYQGAFQVAATVMRSYLTDHGARVVALFSAARREGRTTLAINLAAALARHGLRVLLVDADLRTPRMHLIFGVENTTGLTTLLEDPSQEFEQLLVPTEVASLRVLMSGPAPESPAELLASSSMESVMRKLREAADVVVLDTPALDGGAEALALARLADTCVLTVGAGLSDCKRVARARQLLANVSADVAGALLNFAG